MEPAEGRAAAEEAGAPRERAGCAFGISLGLLFLVALVVTVLTARGRALEPHEVLEPVFAVGTLPFELAPVDAAELPDGTRLARFAHPDYTKGVVPETPESADEPADESDHESDGEPGDESDDESDIHEPPKLVDPISIDSPPVELIISLYPGPGPVEALFGLQRRGGEGTERLEEGDLKWSGWQADFVRDRARLEDGHFRESMRVDLSHDDTWCILAAQWPVDHAASKARVEELLVEFWVLSQSPPEPTSPN